MRYTGGCESWESSSLSHARKKENQVPRVLRVQRVRLLNGISAGGYSKNNNYWLRLSIIWIIMEIEEDNTLWDLHNSSDDTKAEFNNCVIIHSK